MGAVVRFSRRSGATYTSSPEEVSGCLSIASSCVSVKATRPWMCAANRPMTSANADASAAGAAVSAACTAAAASARPMLADEHARAHGNLAGLAGGRAPAQKS